MTKQTEAKTKLGRLFMNEACRSLDFVSRYSRIDLPASEGREVTLLPCIRDALLETPT